MRHFICTPLNIHLSVCWAVLLPIHVFCMSVYWVDLLPHFTGEWNVTAFFRVESAGTQSLIKNVAKTWGSLHSIYHIIQSLTAWIKLFFFFFTFYLEILQSIAMYAYSHVSGKLNLLSPEEQYQNSWIWALLISKIILWWRNYNLVNKCDNKGNKPGLKFTSIDLQCRFTAYVCLAILPWFSGSEFNLTFAILSFVSLQQTHIRTHWLYLHLCHAKYKSRYVK